MVKGRLSLSDADCRRFRLPPRIHSSIAMIRSNVMSIVAVSGLLAVLSSDVPIALSDELNARVDDQPADAQEPSQKSQQDWIRERHEIVARTLKDLADHHRYRCDGECRLKRIGSPFPKARSGIFFTAATALPREVLQTEQNTVIFGWQDQTLSRLETSYGQPFNLAEILDHVIKIKSQDIEGPTQILSQRLAGDWVVRTGATQDQLIEELQTILQHDLKLRVRLMYVKRVRTVYVARGRFDVPLIEVRSTSTAKPAPVFRRIQIYGTLFVGNGVGGGSGDLTEFLKSVGKWINVSIVDEVHERPTEKVNWVSNSIRNFGDPESTAQDHDPELVLANISAQTGLTFTKDYRAVRRLLIESIE